MSSIKSSVVQQARKNRSRKNVDTDKIFTFEQFYEIAEEKVITDLLDGQIFREPSVAPKHGFIVTWLWSVLGFYAEKFDLGEVLGATVAVRFTKYQATEPDAFFIRKNRLHIIGQKYIDGPPDLCIEVISEASSERDRGRKFVLYAEHGVKEYWIVDPLRFTIEFYENQDGEWVEIKPDEHGRLHSKVLSGFWLKAKWFTSAQPLPPVAQALKEILGEERRF
ncbi:Uma2 family endonuclease [candidate division KSB1 bacterium]|nr:Uma2 family endonuclease [candidate division KSB1 bacterium]